MEKIEFLNKEGKVEKLEVLDAKIEEAIKAKEKEIELEVTKEENDDSRKI